MRMIPAKATDTRQRNDQFVASAVFIVARIDLNRPSPAESDQQEKNKPDGIDMRRRVQRNSSLKSGRRITEPVRCQRVSKLVKRQTYDNSRKNYQSSQYVCGY